MSEPRTTRQRTRVVGHLRRSGAEEDVWTLEMNVPNASRCSASGSKPQKVQIPLVLKDEGARAPQAVGAQVLVLGDAVFSPSSELLRIEAEQISIAAGESRIWSRVPVSAKTSLVRSDLVQVQNAHSGLAAIIGKWPGEESDEEVEDALRLLS